MYTKIRVRKDISQETRITGIIEAYHEYELCHRCDHFIELDFNDADEPFMLHLEDDDYEYDHVPAPSGLKARMNIWKWLRPDLFIRHPDGHTGPNSIFHKMKDRP